MAQAFNPISGPEPMNTNKCECSGPYTCKVHDGKFDFCWNGKCLCHPQPGPIASDKEKKPFYNEFKGLADKICDDIKISADDVVLEKASCVCGEPNITNSVHRKDGPCYVKVSWIERFDKEFPELVSMSNGVTYRGVCSRDNVKSFLTTHLERAYEEGTKHTAEAYDMGKRAGSTEDIKNTLVAIEKAVADERQRILKEVDKLRETIISWSGTTDNEKQLLLAAYDTRKQVLNQVKEIVGK